MAKIFNPFTGKEMEVSDEKLKSIIKIAPLSGESTFRTGRTRQDTTSIEGLVRIAESVSGRTGEEAVELATAKEKQGFFSRAIDILSRPQYAVSSAIKNILDDDETTTFFGGLATGFTGKTKTMGVDILEELDLAKEEPETLGGKIAKGVAGFALDVLLDPLTYITFGVGKGIQVAGKTLTKAGQQLLEKGIKQAGGLGEDVVKTAIARMAQKDPTLAKKFFQQGGIKFFGKTLASADQISKVMHAVPGMNVIDEMTLPIRNALGSLFNRDISAKFGKLPKEFTDITQKYRDLALARPNAVVQTFVQIAQGNKLTALEADFITNAIETGKRLADPRLENVKTQIVQQLGRNLKTERGVGIKIGKLQNYVPHILVENKKKASAMPFKPEGARISFGSIKPTESRVFKTFIDPKTGEKIVKKIEGDVDDFFINNSGKKIAAQDSTIKEVKEYFGEDFFDSNIISAATIRGVASARAVTAAEFLRETAQKFGAIGKGIPTNFVEVKGVPQLKGFFFHPAIAESIEGIQKSFINDEATNLVLKQFDKLQNLWKASVTSIFPAFHGRNGISNTLQNALDIGFASIDPRRTKMSLQIMRMESAANKLETLAKGTGASAIDAKKHLVELSTQHILTDNTGKSYTFGELRTLLKEKNIAFTGQHFGFMDIRDEVFEKIPTLKGELTGLEKAKVMARKLTPISKDFMPFSIGRKVGTGIEEHSRILNFLTNLQKRGDASLAAELTKQYLFDYGNLSNFEKNVMRRLIPFYTWPRKNLELQVRTLIKEPGKIVTQIKAFNNIKRATMGESGLTDQELQGLPAFYRNSLAIPFGREGNKLQLITGAQLPAETALQFLPNLLGSLSPALKLPLELATDTDFFRKGKLEDVARNVSVEEYELYPDFIKEYVGFVKKEYEGHVYYKAVDPERYHIIKSIPAASSSISVLKTLKSENVSGKMKILRTLTGIRTTDEIDLDEQKAYEDYKTRKDLEKLLEGLGILTDLSVLSKKEKRKLFQGNEE